jgi:hypothetical protein
MLGRSFAGTGPAFPFAEAIADKKGDTTDV